MGDMRDDFKALDAVLKAERQRLRVSCPGCPKVRPKATPTLLMPQQRCKVCGHRDERPHEA
jgi:rRNA maturation endonuclease Nob1